MKLKYAASPLLSWSRRRFHVKTPPWSSFQGAHIDPLLLRDSPNQPIPKVHAAPPLSQRNGHRYIIYYYDESLPQTEAQAHFRPGAELPEYLQFPAAPKTGGFKMLATVQVLTTPTADTPGTCLMMHFDNRRYFFGRTSEGTQRALNQRKAPINKMGDFFITGPVTWDSVGGLLGMILTVADSVSTSKTSLVDVMKGRKESKVQKLTDSIMSRLNIHAGKNISYLIGTARRFIFRKGIPLVPEEITRDPRLASFTTAEPDYRDENINVWYMPIQSTSIATSPRKRSHDEYATDSDDPDASKENSEFLQTVVTQMFNSDWKLDALSETTLHKVQLPAKIFVRDENGHIQEYKGPLPGGTVEAPDVPVLVRRPWPGAQISELPPTTPSTQSMCYIVKGHTQRGKFDPVAAQKYKIPKPQYRFLTKGESITTEEGVVVTPEMVLGEPNPGKGFAIMDVPDDSYLEAALSRPEWKNAEIMEGVDSIFWLLGKGLVTDPRMEEFMQTMTSVKHIVSSPDTCPNMIALESVAAQGFRLWGVDPDRFPPAIFDNKRSLSNLPLGSGSNLPLPSKLYRPARVGKTIQFMPKLIHQDGGVLPFPDISKMAAMVVQSSKHKKAIQDLTDEARAKTSNPKWIQAVDKVEADIPGRDVEVITLGTGSALPSKYRNVSATLVRVPGVGSYLFDCGENTLGQMRRVFGDELPGVLGDLKAIWISHLHADHHLGTASVIKAWHKETSKHAVLRDSSLLISSHIHMWDWIREYSKVEDFGFHRLTPSWFAAPAHNKSLKVVKPRTFSQQEQEMFGLAKIEACFVQHCYGALATVFTWPSGLKIAYSGDCRPSNDFVAIGKGTTLLIHESTFDDQMMGDAKAKKHSTMGEAINVGRRMGARRILLTHFSQRYQKIPTMKDSFEVNPDATGAEKLRKDEVILVAFDYMRVKLGEFRMAQAFLPAIQKLFEAVDPTDN